MVCGFAADLGGCGSAPVATDSSDAGTDATGVDACTGSCDCEPSGTLLWRSTYRAPELQRVLGRAMARLPDGRLVVAGVHVAYTPDDLVYGDESLWVAIFDREGAIETSTVAFTVPASVSPEGGHGVAADGSRIAVVGSVREGAWPVGVLAVYDLQLEELWTLRDEPEVGSAWTGVALEEDGSVVVTGATYRPTEDSTATVLRLSATGEREWTQQVEGTDSEPYFATNRAQSVATGDGLAWVVGTLYNAHDFGEPDIWAAAWRPDGTMALQEFYDSRTELTTYASTGLDLGHGVAIAPDGAVLVCGVHEVEKPKDVGSYSAGERWARLLGADGAERWTFWHDDPNVYPGAAYGAAFDGCGNAFVVGEESASFEADSHMFLAKLTPNGQLLWDVRDDQPTSWRFGSYAVVADDDGSAVVLTSEGDDTIVLSRWSP